MNTHPNGAPPEAKRKGSSILVASLALFSMFFGAGNLIFPPTLGRNMGSEALISFVGFAVTAVGLVLLAAIATIRVGGTIEANARHLGPKLASLFGGIILVCIGPGLAIPRTAATTHELLAGAFFPGLSPAITAILFFAVTLLFVIKPSNVVNNLGKFLTPFLVLSLALIIGKAILSPLGPLAETGVTDVLASSLNEGYQTMDALAALAFAIVIINDYRSHGETDNAVIARKTASASIFAAIGLVLVYGGLMYAGATTSSLGVMNLDRVPLLIFLMKNLAGTIGMVLISLAMILACLTTAIGLTSTFGDFCERTSGGRIGARTWAILCVIVSAAISVLGVDQIVSISAPILSAVYPMAIVLIFLNLIGGPLDRRPVHIGAVLGALIPAVDILVGWMTGTPLLIGITGDWPLLLQSFYWLIPSACFAAIGLAVSRKR